MNYTPDYQIALPDGSKIPLLFNSWTFRQFSLQIGTELEELMQNVREGRAFKGKDLPALLLLAAESHCKFNHKECTYNDLDACSWIDALGGFNSLDLVHVYKFFISKLLNVSIEQFDVLWKKILSGEPTENKAPEEHKKKAKQK